MKPERSVFHRLTLAVPISAAVLVLALGSGCASDDPAQTETPVPRTAEPTASLEPTASVVPTQVPEGQGMESPDQRPEGATDRIGDVVDSPREDEQVVIGGRISEMVSAEDFMLDDGTGEVFVDGDNDFGSLAAEDIVVVTGTVDVEDSPPRIEIQATAVERR